MVRSSTCYSTLIYQTSCYLQYRFGNRSRTIYTHLFCASTIMSADIGHPHSKWVPPRNWSVLSDSFIAHVVVASTVYVSHETHPSTSIIGSFFFEALACSKEYVEKRLLYHRTYPLQNQKIFWFS